MKKYNIDDIIMYIENGKYDEINEIVNKIISSKEHCFNDLEVLNCLINSQKIAFDSKEKMKTLYLEYKKDIEERILSNRKNNYEIDELSVYNRNDKKINIEPTLESNTSAYVELKTVALIVGLTILVIIVVTYLTLRG